MPKVINEADLAKVNRDDYEEILLCRPGEQFGLAAWTRPMGARSYAPHAPAQVSPDRRLVVEVESPDDSSVRERVQRALGILPK